MKSGYHPQIARSLLFNISKFCDKIVKIPFSFVLQILFISAISIFTLYSAANGSMYPWAFKQLIFLTISIPIMVIISIIDVKFYYNIAYISYVIALIMLILVELFGYKAMGATRWINLIFFKLQPADVMKIALILCLARYYTDLKSSNISKITSLIIPLILILMPIILIIRQPDLGTAVILILLSTAILFSAGINIWNFIVAGVSVLISIPYIWTHLHTYQKLRIITFINPESDPLGAGYNIIQSKIAIGSAGLFGKGFLKGSQSQLSFLPERHTDFIFTMFAEEWGFIGSMLLLLIYTIITFRGMKIAVNCKNHFGRLLASGVISLFFIHVVINIGMVIGLLPVVGVPLPLFSYGGTMMLTIYMGFGLVLNSFLYRKININSGIKTLF